MKSTDRILAKRYARAYDALSVTAAQAADAAQALGCAAAALAQVQSYMCDPALSTGQKISLVQEVFGKQQQVACFLAELLKAKRYYLLEACTEEVQHFLDQRQGIVRAQVQTAFALSEAEKKQVQEVLSKFTGKKAQATFAVQPDLLGGLRARVGDRLIEGSLKGRFEKLQQELIK